MAKTTALESTRVFFASISSLFHDPGYVHFSISDLLQTLEALRLIIIATYRLLRLLHDQWKLRCFLVLEDALLLPLHWVKSDILRNILRDRFTYKLVIIFLDDDLFLTFERCRYF